MINQWYTSLQELRVKELEESNQKLIEENNLLKKENEELTYELKDEKEHLKKIISDYNSSAIENKKLKEEIHKLKTDLTLKNTGFDNSDKTNVHTTLDALMLLNQYETSEKSTQDIVDLISGMQKLFK